MVRALAALAAVASLGFFSPVFAQSSAPATNAPGAGAATKDSPTTGAPRADAPATDAPTTGAADAGAAGAAAPTGVLTKAPQLLKQIEAKFPPELADAGQGGTVVMEIDIGADGKVMDVRVVQSAGEAFDAAALEAVRQFEFSPAEVDHQPAPVRIQYAYEFLFRPQTVELPPEQPIEQTVNFSGVLLQRGTRRPLANATVVVELPDGPAEAMSDAEGRFELRGLPPGTHHVVVVAQDHAKYEVDETIEAGRRTEATYYVRALTYGTYETVVRAERERKEVSTVNLRQEEIRLMPGSQGDALRVVQNLPGVARAPFSGGVLVVRGGKPWDTRVYVDNTLVPQLFHFGGLYATFNSNLLEDINFQPGNFSAEYGRNIGGLVRGKTRTPSKEGVHGYADLNLIDLSALVEAPINDEWSIAVGGRRSHVDSLLPFVLDVFFPEADDVLNFTVAPRYYDYQVKVERRVGKSRDRMSLMLFGSNDYVSFVLQNPAYDPEGRADFETLLSYNRLAFNWEQGLGGKVRSVSHLSAGFDRYDFGAGSDLYAKTTLFPIQGRQAFAWDLLDEKLLLTAGLDVYALPWNNSTQAPPRFKLNQIPDPFVTRKLVSEDTTNFSLEPSVFAEAVWQPTERIKIVPGFRIDYEQYMNDVWFDPRLAAFARVGERTTLKGGIGVFHQPPDYRQGQLSRTFGNPELKPEGGIHYSVGAEHQFTDAIGLDVQLYYKSLFDQSVATLAAPAGESASVDNVDVRFESVGEGRSYGVEILLRHQLTKNFFAWVAYSLSRTERKSPLRNGEIEPSPLDQPHNVVALASYKLPGDWVIGGRVRYTSGPLNTPYVGAIYDANGNYYFPIPGERFSRRLPAFFQLDLRVDKRFVYDTWMLAVYADVQNVTNRGNVEGVFYNYNYTEQAYVTGLPILPALGVRGEW